MASLSCIFAFAKSLPTPLPPPQEMKMQPNKKLYQINFIAAMNILSQNKWSLRKNHLFVDDRRYIFYFWTSMIVLFIAKTSNEYVIFVLKQGKWMCYKLRLVLTLLERLLRKLKCFFKPYPPQRIFWNWKKSFFLSIF